MSGRLRGSMAGHMIGVLTLCLMLPPLMACTVSHNIAPIPGASVQNSTSIPRDVSSQKTSISGETRTLIPNVRDVPFETQLLSVTPRDASSAPLVPAPNISPQRIAVLSAVSVASLIVGILAVYYLIRIKRRSTLR